MNTRIHEIEMMIWRIITYVVIGLAVAYQIYSRSFGEAFMLFVVWPLVGVAALVAVCWLVVGAVYLLCGIAYPFMLLGEAVQKVWRKACLRHPKLLATFLIASSLGLILWAATVTLSPLPATVQVSSVTLQRVNVIHNNHLLKAQFCGVWAQIMRGVATDRNTGVTLESSLLLREHEYEQLIGAFNTNKERLAIRRAFTSAYQSSATPAQAYEVATEACMASKVMQDGRTL